MLKKILPLAVIALALIPSAASAASKKVMLRFSSTAYSVSEGNKTFNVTVQRQGNTSVESTATVTDGGTGTATSANYSFTPVTLDFLPGQTQKSVPVTIKDNALFEPNHTIVLKLTALTPTGTQVKTPSTTITILEDDGPGTIDLASPSYSVIESAGVATITVSRYSNATNVSETVDYTTTALVAGSGHATAGVDYLTSSGTITFGPNDTTKSFQVPVLDDSNYEGNETLGLTLSNAKNVTNPAQPPNLGPDTPGTLTIVDDDVPTFAFSRSTYSVNENGGPATITVTRGGATNIPVSVNYATSNGTAVAGSDYTAASGTLSFAAGETSKTFTVPITDDGVQEGNETIALQLTDPVSGNPLSSATLSIVDDDNPAASLQFSDVAYSVQEAETSATITVSLSKVVGSPVSVHYATADETQTPANNPASSGSDYDATSGTLTFAPGETSKTFPVPIHQDTLAEGDETLDLTLSSPSNAILGAPSTAVLTIVDDDLQGSLEFDALRYDVNEDAGQATVTVRRTDGASGAVSVDYATSDGTANASDDYAATSGTLEFADGETQKTFVVPIVWDARAEGPETINLTLSNPGDGADLGANSAAVIRIADDGVSGPVRFSASSYSVGESDGLVTITVTRSGGSMGGPVTVDYTTADDTATAGSDYSAVSGTLTFGPGEATKSFTVPITSDSAIEGDESFQVMLSNPTGGANLGTPAGAAVTIADDDAAPTPPVDPPSSPAAPSTPATSPSTPATSPSAPAPSPSPTPARDTTAPKLALTAKRVQKALRAKRLVLAAKCDENCDLNATAQLTVVVRARKHGKAIALGRVARVTAAANHRVVVKVKLSKKALTMLAKALGTGKVKVTVTVVARDTAGNTRRASRLITVRH